MTELIRKTFLFGIGLAVLVREKSGDIIKMLIEKGEKETSKKQS